MKYIMAEFASKGVAGSGLGLGIAGTALGLLNNGGGVMVSLVVSLVTAIRMLSLLFKLRMAC